MANDPIVVGNKVQIFLNAKTFGQEGWFDGLVVRIDPLFCAPQLLLGGLGRRIARDFGDGRGAGFGAESQEYSETGCAGWIR